MKYEINIDGFIGTKEWWMDGDNFTLKDLQAKLAAMPTDTEEINVVINSGGGYVTEGFAIHDLLATQSIKVNTTALGICGSIATVIGQAAKSQNKGGVRKGYQNSDYYIHNPGWSPQSADPLEADELQKIADELKANEDKLINFYAAVSGKDAATFKEKMSEAKSLSMAEAKDLALIDEVITTNIKATTVYKFAAHISKPNTAMNAIETKIKKMFSDFSNEVKETIAAIVKQTITNAQSTTDDGTVIYYDGELKVGTKCFIDAEMQKPLDNGTYKVDGKSYVVVDGAVAEVIDAEDNTTALKTENESLKKQVADLTEAAKVANEKVAEVQNTLNEKVASIEKEVNDKIENFKANFFTGDKLKPEFTQNFRGDNSDYAPKDPIQALKDYQKKKKEDEAARLEARKAKK